LRFGGGTRKSRPPPLEPPKDGPTKPERKPIESSGRVTSPVNFVPSRPDFSLPLTSEILTVLKNRYVIIGGNLAFCLLPTAAMNDKKTWWQVLPIGKKGSIFAGVIAFALVVFLAWPNDRGSSALQQQEEKIRDMEDRIARLQKELEESSKQIASLQPGSDETPRARRSAQRNVNNSRREETRLADQNPSTEPRVYQTVRSTSVFEEPSASSRKVGSIGNGSRVRVVGSTGDWLEVRSKQGRPPGFIRRDDAVLMR
jgi:FtsZ-binding cell division protein ZapB